MLATDERCSDDQSCPSRALSQLCLVGGEEMESTHLQVQHLVAGWAAPHSQVWLGHRCLQDSTVLVQGKAPES